MSDAESLGLLAAIAAIPTAPFHENDVAAFVARYIRNLGVPLTVDPYGNLIATYQNGDSRRPIAFVAHLDHPAIEITEVQSTTTARAALLGGVPAACFERPVPVSLFTRAGSISAVIVGRNVNPADGRVASLAIECAGGCQVGDWGVFDLSPFAIHGTRVELRAADDLAGVAAALEALREIVASRVPGTAYGVFTRAEEVGLVGAALVAEQRLLPPDTIVVSLECSRALPGAEIGAGPVIRVGDRTGAFHPDGEALLLAGRDRIKETLVQRQLMSGGTCEATAFIRAGYRATGIALPLGNYHNVGPTNLIEPEYIDRDDFLAEIRLLVAATWAASERLVAATGMPAAPIELHRQRLMATASFFLPLTQPST